MKVVFEDQEKKKKRRIIIAVTAVLLALIAAVVIFFVFKDQIRATTMRILRIEGIVNLEEDGLEKTISENLRLKSGNALGTAEQSLVSIGLDETKIVTLDELSRAEFEQKGKKLDLNLTRGSLFFEVSKPLEDAESFNIHTTTMVVGIRGTSGHVFVKNGQEGLVITDGQVHVIGTNPTTGEVKEIDVHAGERILVYLYNDRTVDSIEFKLEKITEHELDEFVLKILRENPELLDKVVAQTKWDKDWILGVKKDEAVNPSEEGAQVTEPSEPTPTPTPTPEPEDTETEEKPQETSGRTEPAEGPTEDQLTRAKNAIQATDAATGILALKDGTLFDPAFYAASNPDVVRVYGTDPVSLLAHWLSYGRREGRPPIAIPTPTPTPTPTFDPNAGKSGGS
ncbi:MAG: FecR domain-containing protein, partial [Lachnospiraceae bacterium]|nr:FecR domain-containing protein [Lachnospiraceae bacterium]